MKLPIFLLLTALVPFLAIAQPSSTINESIMMEVGEEKLAASDYYNALDWYKQAYDEQKKKDNGLRYQIAQLHYILRDYNKAEKWFSRVVKRDKKGEIPEALFYYAMSMKHNGLYPDAKSAFESYQEISKDDAMKAKAALEIAGIDYALAAPKNKALRVNNAGKKVNGKFSEYSPFMVGTDLYYSAMVAKEAVILNGKEGDYYSKIFKSSLNEDKEYDKPSPLSDEVNRKGYHTGNVHIAPEGDRMFFTRSTLEGNVIGESTIYMAEKIGAGWGRSKPVEGVNGEWHAKHPCIGELFGKEALFFVSNMAGGKGGDDIYYAPANGDGTFGLPVNLGDAINTPYDEVTPFYRDGKLWFSSNGRPSMGGLDIFSSTWNGSNWSQPENLGQGYNSSVDDFGFYVDDEGYLGAFISNRPSINSLKSKTCCDDVFIASVKKVAVDVDALVFAEDKKPIKGATVQLIKVKDGEFGETDQNTSAATNKTNFLLDLAQGYSMIATADGFYPDTLYFNTVGIKESKTLSKKFYLKPIPKEPEIIEETVYINQAIRLNNIYYDYDDDKILLDAEEDLNTLLGLLIKYPDMVIELSSHTDSRGSKTYNQELSQRRAESAKNWLLAKGIVSERIKPVGYGEAMILNKCTNGVRCSDEEHRFNRRTEFKIIAGPTSIQIPKKVKKVKTDKDTGSISTEKSTHSTKVASAISQFPAKKKDKSAGKNIIKSKAKNPAKTTSTGLKSVKASDKKAGVPVITFDEPTYDIGVLKQGDVFKKSFTFTNTGDGDLIIEIATGSCGCTVPDWPVKTIKPGETNAIDITYDSKDKEGDQRVEITIVANTEPIVSELILTAKVVKP